MNIHRRSAPVALAWIAALVACPALARAQFNIAAPAPAQAAPLPAPGAPAGPASASTGPVLTLPNGGFAAGELLDSADPKVIRWRSPAFAGPVEFRSSALSAIRWPSPPKRVDPSGEFRFELAGGDVVFGRLVALDDATAEVDLPGLGRFHVDRKSVQRIQPRRDGAEMIYSGPNGLADWKEPKPKGSWREEGGQVLSDQPGSTLQGGLGLPDRAVIEFELSWKGAKPPDFILALGVDDEKDSLKQAFRFEVWDGHLIVDREAGPKADLASLGKVNEMKNRVHLIAYLDQSAGRILVVGPNGKPLADLTVPAPRESVVGDGLALKLLSTLKVPALIKPGVALVNVKGDVRLERLRIGRWDGTSPRPFDADRSRIHLADGSVTYGQVAGYDPEGRAFTVKDGGAESKVAVDRIADVFLSRPDDDAPRPTKASLVDGTRLGGELRKVEAGRAEFAVPGFREPVSPPVAALLSLAWPRPEVIPGTPGGRPGVLEVEGARLPGSLADGRVEGEDGGLTWLAGGASPASLRPGVSGQITYAEPKPPAPATATPPPARPQNAMIVLNNVVGQLTNTAANTAAKRKDEARRALHLRTGDVIPCEITAIDEEGVRFISPLAPGTFVPHAKVKAIELAPLDPVGIKVGKAKRERMLTLPRMQKDSPPTQLIRSTNGDYLRGRILAMDGSKLDVEVHLDPKAIPRDRVARIIWFHADELDPSKAPAPAAEDKKGARVQAVRSDGVRVTFRAEGFAKGVLAGTSDVLGPITVKPEDVDQVLLGSKIEQAAAQVAYGRWTLHNAEEPKFVKGTDGGETPSGTDSPLVGKPAPDFTIDLLDGKKFHLADHKGKVVILDFWATWCGPCLQAMPQVERAAKEFADRGVELYAVNLQEAPRDIKAMLERHKFDVTVALDRDGVVAERYAATAIPQTVIIDREGKVARLYVGSSPDLEKSLRDSLNALQAPAPAPASK